MRVRQIVTNGLTNAIKYATPATHGPIRVVCTPRGAAESAPTATSERDAAEDGVGGVTDIIKTQITVQILDRGLGSLSRTAIHNDAVNRHRRPQKPNARVEDRVCRRRTLIHPSAAACQHYVCGSGSITTQFTSIPLEMTTV
jgi:hypothetical protein